MNDKILKALKGSIRKWKRIVAGTGEDLGTKNCPLCMDYCEDGSKENAIRELNFLKSLLPKK